MLVYAGIKTISGFTDNRFGHKFKVLEHNGISVLRPRLGFYDDVREVCKAAFGVELIEAVKED